MIKGDSYRGIHSSPIAAYLIFLGILLLKVPKQRLQHEGRSDILAYRHLDKQWLLGFVSAILNPKNGIFYLSLFTVLVSVETEFARRCLYALWMTTVVFLWDAALVFILGSRRIGDRLKSSIFWLEKFSGLMLTFFGCYLPFY
jgi:threonine/homoserine/homoserine lactone efflux protein